MTSERVVLLVNGTVNPKNVSEKILMYAYNSALQGDSLVTIFLQITNRLNGRLSGTALYGFVLGYSAGSQVLKFTQEEANSIPDESIN